MSLSIRLSNLSVSVFLCLSLFQPVDLASVHRIATERLTKIRETDMHALGEARDLLELR